ncbi:MAG: pyridoxal-phosphate dependent enzyme [Desulfobacterales bacterium]|nr:pyridoxal-phosphate dependent enzyme [Desulfobacterales bacterium]
MALHIRTPLFESVPISRHTDKSVFLKMECFQPAGSFKIRGIGRLCEQHVSSGKSSLISSSGGNAGYAVAYSGRNLGAKVTVIVPETTSEGVCQQIRLEGAEVKIYGSVWDESHEYACNLAEKINGAYIHPFDHPGIWKGHATIVDELAEQCVQKPDAVVLSVGGGGLLCGIAEGLERNGWTDVPVVAVETEGAASLAASVKKGKLISLEKVTSIATTLGAKQVASKAFDYARALNINPVTVADSSAVDACLKFSYDHRVLVEPACGASLSVVYNCADIIKSAGTVVVIVCGGTGVSIEKLLQWQK